jgi:hypothetical protein
MILQAPMGFVPAATRLLLGVLSAAIAASVLDIILYDREIVSTLKETMIQRLAQDQARERASIEEGINTGREAWLDARQTANCEGNGTCGSRQRNAGPLYRELLAHAERLHREYEQAAAAGEEMKRRHHGQLELITDNSVRSSAGLIARLEALDSHLRTNTTSLVFWALTFAFMLLIELSVLIVKFSYGETIDDRLERSYALRAIHDAERLMLARLRS